MDVTFPLQRTFGPGTAYDPGFAVVTGGITTGGGYTATTEHYIPDGDTWTAGTSLDQARGAQAGVGIRDKMYVTCGQATGPVYKTDHDEYYANSWTARTVNPSAARSYLASSEHPTDDKLYTIGGYDTAYYADNDQYDQSGQSWSGMTDLTATRRSPGNCTTNYVTGKIYWYGGYNSAGTIVSNVYEYTPAAGWSTLTNGSWPRANSTTGARWQNRIYCFSGRNGRLNHSFYYNVEAETSTYVGVNPAGTVQHLRGFSYHNSVYNCGGAATAYSVKCYEYNTLSSSFTQMDDMTTARQIHACGIM